METDPTKEEEETEDEKKEPMTAMFTEYRTHIWALRQSNIEHLDNLILTLSSAILGLSLTFIKDIVSLERAAWLGILVASWALLSCTIISTLLSYWAAHKENDDQVAIAEKYYIYRIEKAFEETSRWRRMTEYCNHASSWCFGVAVVLLIFFVSVNLFREHNYLIRKEATSTMNKDRIKVVPMGDAVTSPRMQKIVLPEPLAGVISPQMPPVGLPTPQPASIVHKVAPVTPKK